MRGRGLCGVTVMVQIKKFCPLIPLKDGVFFLGGSCGLFGHSAVSQAMLIECDHCFLCGCIELGIFMD